MCSVLTGDKFSTVWLQSCFRDGRQNGPCEKEVVGEEVCYDAVVLEGNPIAQGKNLRGKIVSGTLVLLMK